MTSASFFGIARNGPHFAPRFQYFDPVFTRLDSHRLLLMNKIDANPGKAGSRNQAERLPMGALLALAMTGFTCIATETMPSGLLPQIADGLQVSQSFAGQTVTAYAVGSLLAAIPLTIATQGWRRRTVLVSTIVGFLIFNSITAISTHYSLTLAARFFAGVSAGLAWSLIAGYARRMVRPSQQGRALAVAMVGIPIALSLGVPLSTWLGTAVGWRSAFGVMSLLTLLLIAWVMLKVPDYPGRSDSPPLSLFRVFTTPGVRPVLGAMATWMLGHSILYTYIAPFVAASQLGNSVDIVLLVFGVASLAGNWIIGKVVDDHLRISVLLSIAGFGVTALIFGLLPGNSGVVYIGVAAWGLTFGGAATLLLTALADAAAEGSDAALSMNVFTWNCALAGGGLLGGVLLDRFGVVSFPWVVAALAFAGLWIAVAARDHGFPPGHRRISVGITAAP
jgi:predicted MFS family arabinose efflux permease